MPTCDEPMGVEVVNYGFTEYHLDPFGSSQVGMSYIVGNLSPNATRIYVFRHHCFSLTAVARKRQCVISLYWQVILTTCLLPFYCATQLPK